MTERFERDGVTVTITQGTPDAPGFIVIEAPAVHYRFEARPVAGGERWDFESQLDGKLAHRGRVDGWEGLVESMPASIVDQAAGIDIPILDVFLQLATRTGKLTAPGRLQQRRDTIADLVVGIEEEYGAGAVVEMLRHLAARHGYSLTPDESLIRKVGECHAYHELQGAAFDRMMSGAGLEDLLREARFSTERNKRLFGGDE